MIRTVLAWRHGQALTNQANGHAYRGEWDKYQIVRGLYNDPYDAPLTDKGREQVRALRPYVHRLIQQLSGDASLHAYTSPQPRACETAQELDLGIPFALDHRLRERSKGEYERGIYNTDNFSAMCEAMTGCVRDPFCTPPGGESVAARYTELQSFFAEHEEGGEEKTLLLSCHGELLRIMALVLHQRPLSDWGKVQFTVKNCLLTGYTKVEPQSRKRADKFSWVIRVCVEEDQTELFWTPEP